MRVAQHERGTWRAGGGGRHQGLISFKIENNSRHLNGAYFIPGIVSSNFYVFLRVWALCHSVILLYCNIIPHAASRLSHTKFTVHHLKSLGHL